MAMFPAKGSPVKYGSNAATTGAITVTDEAPIFFKKYLAASLPAAADWEGAVILVDASGTLTLRYSNGTNWTILSATALP
jgi:hypothetical protein